MLREQTDNWNKTYTENEQMAYPAEYVIRMFKGSYPRLNLKMISGGDEGKSILDIGCGDGRHLCFFNTLGFSRIADFRGNSGNRPEKNREVWIRSGYTGGIK